MRNPKTTSDMTKRGQEIGSTRAIPKRLPTGRVPGRSSKATPTEKASPAKPKPGTEIFSIRCKVCGQKRTLCACLLNDRSFLAGEVGKKLKAVLLGGKAQDHSTHQGDKTPTPPEIAQWVFDQIKRAGYHPNVILDPCAGAGNLNAPFRQSGCTIIEYEKDRGTDFFLCDKHLVVDLVLANTPWRDGPNGERGGEVLIVWLQQIVAVVGKTTPLVFFLPLHLLSPWIGSKYYNYLRSDDCPKLSNITPLPRGVFDSVDAPSAILWCNLPKVVDVAVLPTEVCEAAKRNSISYLHRVNNVAFSPNFGLVEIYPTAGVSPPSRRHRRDGGADSSPVNRHRQLGITAAIPGPLPTSAQSASDRRRRWYRCDRCRG